MPVKEVQLKSMKGKLKKVFPARKVGVPAPPADARACYDCRATDIRSPCE